MNRYLYIFLKALQYAIISIFLTLRISPVPIYAIADDNTGPEINEIQITNNGETLTSGDSFTVSFQVSDKSGIDDINVCFLQGYEDADISLDQNKLLQ